MTRAAGSLASRLIQAPVVSAPEEAAVKLDGWLASGAHAELVTLAQTAPVRDLLLGIADHSPFLWRLMSADPERCFILLDRDPAASLGVILAETDTCGASSEQARRGLRRARQSLALLVAFADIGGVWTVEEVTRALTDFADAACRTALRAVLAETVGAGKLLPPSPGQGAFEGCGLTVLALGKQGACELNYSSDIDLVVFFDPKAPRLPEGATPSPLYVRITQAFVKLLQERTEDEYVARVDLRLRPDPASTAVAIGLSSAFSYYESYGQNWERAAYIKARPVAGDLALGERFLAELAPFVWRKYFDFAAIADVHAMKRQIHAAKGHGSIAVAGHNIKLGRGGIREVEFFVQTQQLIFGGRRAQLRGRQTLPMLRELLHDGWIGESADRDLSAAYRFLRTVEHRLQMVADEQTQRLPDNEAALERFARFAGFADLDAFSAALREHLGRVEKHYARLFEHAPGLTASIGNLVFTGTADDPETLVTLQELGFQRPSDAAETIRGWHFGRRAAVQSPRAREILTELVPALLEAFSVSADPDGALAAMDSMLARMPAAMELLSMLRSNEAIRFLVTDVLGSAPRLAETIAARPHVLDAAIDPSARLPAKDGDARARLSAQVSGVANKEEWLDRLRVFAQEEQFLIGMRSLAAIDPSRTTGRAYARVADAVIDAALARCLDEFAAEHGWIPGGACAVLGMGKLGSDEMTATSDLDLIVISRFEAEAESDGPRPLDGSRYYTRLTQRLIAALTVPTRRGRLYDVDVRLRPSGRQGPLTTQFRSFVQYQAEEAQTWEHMALTRARMVAGDARLGFDIEHAIRTTLTRNRDPELIRQDVATMRALIRKEKGDGSTWDMKLARGGLLDLEFIAQFLVLAHAPQHPSLLLRHPQDILLEAARLDILNREQADALAAAHDKQSTISQMTRLAGDGAFDPAKAGRGFLRRLAVALNQPDLSALESALADARLEVSSAFDELIGGQ